MTGRFDILAASVIKNFRERGLSLALAESCTGGMISVALTDISGASDIFWGSAVTYINGAKEQILGVSAVTLEKHGAVSEECAREMAAGARRIYGADIAMSVTGIAGPKGGSDTKPVGTVWFGLSSRNTTEAFRCQLEGNRKDIRLQTVERALVCLIEKSAVKKRCDGALK